MCGPPPRKPRLASSRTNRRARSRAPFDLPGALLLATLALAFLLYPTAPSNAEELGGEFQRFPIETFTERAGIFDITASTDGNEWLVEEEDFPPAALVKVNASGEVVAEFPVPHRIGGITRGLDGDVWFTELASSSLEDSTLGRVSPTGRITTYDIPNSGNSALPAGLVVGVEGDAWVALPEAGTIDRFSPSGLLLEEFPTQKGIPNAIAAAPDGGIWFTDERPLFDVADQPLIGKIDSSGHLEEHEVPANKIVRINSLIDLRALTTGPEGDAWALYTGFYEDSVFEGSYLARMEPSGAVTEYQLPSLHYVGLHGLAAGPDGNLWFGGNGEGLTRMTPAGETSTFVPSGGSNENVQDLAVADDGDLWYFPTEADSGFTSSNHYHLERFVIPLPPGNESAPTLSTATTVGETLTTTDGTWSHKPAATSYQWQTCDAAGNGCTNIASESSNSHVIGGDDVGHTLRVVVSVSGPGGSASATSLPSGVLVAPVGPKSAPTISPTATLKSLPGVSATWKFDWSRRYTVVKSLVVRGLPEGATVKVSCSGRGCAFRERVATRSTKAPGTVDLGKWFGHHRLAPGAKFTVTISQAGHVEKDYVFAIRAKHAPKVQIGCRSSEASRAIGSC